MSTITVPSVLAWQPDGLAKAAGDLDPIAEGIDSARADVRRAADTLATAWIGPASQAARTRIDRDLRDATELAAAVRAARSALQSGSSSMGTARARLATVVSSAAATGYRVGDDGSVTPPPVTPVMSSPERAAEARAAVDAQVQLRQSEATRIAGEVSAALAAAGAADRTTAGALDGVVIPQGMQERVESFARTVQGSDVYSALGDAGGLAAGVVALKKAWTLYTRGASFATFLSKSVRAAVTSVDAARFITGSSTDAAALARFSQLTADADKALDAFRFAPKTGFLGGARTLAGKAFLPLTIFSGASDVVTGGGYDGARGLTTRVLGGAGAAGALTLLVGAGPVGLAVAGAAVLAYGAWSLGNLVYDHWDDIKEFGGKAISWTGDKLQAAGGWAGNQVDKAAGWADNQVDRATDAAKDVAGNVREKAGAVVDAVLPDLPF